MASLLKKNEEFMTKEKKMLNKTTCIITQYKKVAFCIVKMIKHRKDRH